MHTIEPDVNRPDPELVAAFEEIPNSIVSDATGNVGVGWTRGSDPSTAGPIRIVLSDITI